MKDLGESITYTLIFNASLININGDSRINCRRDRRNK